MGKYYGESDFSITYNSALISLTFLDGCYCSQKKEGSMYQVHFSVIYKYCIIYGHQHFSNNQNIQYTSGVRHKKAHDEHTEAYKNR